MSDNYCKHESKWLRYNGLAFVCECKQVLHPSDLLERSKQLERQLAEATARADDAEGINLAVTEQMKIIASFTDNTASVKAEGIREAVKSIKFTGCRADDSMLKTYIEFLVEYAKSLEDKT